MWKPVLGPSSLRAVTVSFPGMIRHHGNLVPHSLGHGVPCRERHVVAGGVPEPAQRGADATGSENRDLHRSSRHDRVSELSE